MVGLLGHLCFLNCHCFLGAFEANSSLTKSLASLVSQLPSPYSSWVHNLPYVHSGPVEFPRIEGPPEFCAHRHLEHWCVGSKDQMHMSCASHSIVPSDSTYKTQVQR
jgi:hypothetical protein